MELELCLIHMIDCYNGLLDQVIIMILQLLYGL